MLSPLELISVFIEPIFNNGKYGKICLNLVRWGGGGSREVHAYTYHMVPIKFFKQVNLFVVWSDIH